MVAYAGLISLYQQVRHCEVHRIPGALVECGVWKGGSVGLMAQACRRFGTEPRDLHLFDAFDDICEPDAAVDGEEVAQIVRSKVPGAGTEGGLRPIPGIYADKGGPGSVEGCRELLTETLGYDARRVHFHRGWFQETVPAAAAGIGPIAVLRLDGDWYASTKVCLEGLFDQVVPGGFVVIDDYGAYEGCRKATDEFLGLCSTTDGFLHYVTPDIRYLVKRV